MKRQPTFPRISNFFGENININSFDKIRTLGKGSFGQVTLYRHKQTGKDYAIKKIQLNRTKKINRRQLQIMTKKQIQILYKLDNQHIIKLLDHFEDDNAVYLITEFVEGINLYELSLNKPIKLNRQEIAHIIYQCCLGLQQLHNNHIIHRDIKLQNLVYSNQIVKIVDLGCSDFFGQNIERKTTIGTRLYYSPQILLRQQQNDRLDIWCLGVVLYELLFRQNPFNEPDIEKKIRKIQYSFPQQVQPQLKDLFKNIFTFKENRISAGHLKKHPWIMKYCKDKIPRKIKFEDIFTQFEVQDYREFLEDYISKEKLQINELRQQDQILQNMLKQANRELKQLRNKQIK